ncbi:MAG: GNAT family N-acetyltransferase [Rhizobiaceae bacterium]
MQIRRAEITEANELTELIIRSKQSDGYSDDFMDACREALKVTPETLNESVLWIAEKGRVCGCACLSDDEDPNSAEVASFFIDPDFKRQGAGQLLWEKLLDRSREHGIRFIHLDADPFAVPFYKRQGFKIIRQITSSSVPGRTIPYMELHLV